MNNEIQKLYESLKRLCKREGLPLVVEPFKNDEAVFFRYRDKVVCNAAYFGGGVKV